MAQTPGRTVRVGKAISLAIADEIDVALQPTPDVFAAIEPILRNPSWPNSTASSRSLASLMVN